LFQTIVTKKIDGTLIITYLGSYTFTQLGEKIVLSLDEPIKGVSGITLYEDSTSTTNSKHYLKKFFRYKNGDNNWSELIPLQDIITIETCPDSFNLEIYIYRVDDENINLIPITIANPIIKGNYVIDVTDGIVTLKSGDDVILEPKDIYKVFNITDFQVQYNGDISNVNIKYRWTQNNGKKWTKWEDLTKENISTQKLDELRFAKIQYLISKANNDSSPNIPNYPTTIYDIVLIGDFQNVTANSLKLNKYGLKEDCINLKNIEKIQNDLGRDFYTQNLSCYMADDAKVSSGIAATDNKNGYWNPYNLTKITDFYKNLSNQVSDLFGWIVEYHLTDTDANGSDVNMHEYSLHNVIDMKNIKVIVPDNKFQDNQVQFNQFQLSLFDTFEIQITKDEFKNAFGIDKRPRVQDYLYFCEVNRMYRVKHSQVSKNILNTGAYYRVILEKYEQKANILNLSAESKIATENLTNNTTIDKLFGFEEKQEQNKIANKVQQAPLSVEKIRLKLNDNLIINKESVYNNEFEFIKYNYDFSKIKSTDIAVYYINADRILDVFENRSFIMWFNFKNNFTDNSSVNNKVIKSYNIDNTKTYNLLHNLKQGQGYQINYNNKGIVFQLNDKFYKLNCNLMTNIWYGLVINLEQRQKTIDMKIYTRDANINIIMINPNSYQMAIVDSEDINTYNQKISEGYVPVNNEQYVPIINQFNVVSSVLCENVDLQKFEFENQLKIYGSNIKYSNLRIFDTILPDESINNVLNQYIVDDSQNLILGDNATQQIYTTRYKTNMNNSTDF